MITTTNVRNMPPAKVPDFGARRSGGSGDLRHGNLTQILRYVRDHGASSRHDIAQGCGHGISTMTDQIGELRSRRLVRELDPVRRAGAGRPTRPIAFDGEPWCVLGIHIDVDQVSFAASTVGGRELWSEKVRLELRHTGPGGYPLLAEVLRNQLQQIPVDMQLISIEIGIGGSIAPDRTTVTYSANFDLRDFDLGAAVTQTLDELGMEQVSVSVSNECQLAALFATRIELPLPADAVAAYFGGTRTIGTGLIARGEIFRGAAGGAGQFAHGSVEPAGPACWCGRSGCLESLAGPLAVLTDSGVADPERAQEMIEQDPAAACQLLVEAAESGNQRVIEVLGRAGDHLGRVVDGVIGAVNPHAVILGGYLGVVSAHLLPRLHERLAVRLADPAYAETQVLALKGLGPRTVQGATLAARDACFYDPLALTRPVS